MGLAKYERVSRRDDDYEEDDEDEQQHEVELGNRTGLEYGEGSSSLTASSPSPVINNNTDYRIRKGGGGGGATNGNKTSFSAILPTALVILLYFTLSIGLTFYQSSLLEVSRRCCRRGLIDLLVLTKEPKNNSIPRNSISP